ncbi:hypothetical protein [Pararhizobium antarcticum]|uniref:Uncharacterized protein n=1 Tax=Pararhizobium antarcticum TaxID=1798805 RepID=A0A657LXX6_9HYPH|nr:hypothetical protein [Pararhizobium antarcticum]OJF95450.1 hypothetical protein AX761_17745 [Rhizobium sp. 58]OJF97928.1 hypothetical protein AX760_15835 [Pararhizobium antarcticum]
MHTDNRKVLPDISPEDLGMLQRIFNDVCRRKGLAIDSPEAADDAARVIHLFQHGIRSEIKLTRMLMSDTDAMAS